MEAFTDRQPENTMHPTHLSVGVGIKMKTTVQDIMAHNKPFRIMLKIIKMTKLIL